MELVWYGNEWMYHGRCQACREVGFVRNGRCGSCNAFVAMPDKIRERRGSEVFMKNRRVLSAEMKRKILGEQFNCCIYCGSDLAGTYFDGSVQKEKKIKIQFDHFIPWVLQGNDAERNIFAACQRCNLVKTSRVFSSMESAREYIKLERIGKGDTWIDQGLLF